MAAVLLHPAAMFASADRRARLQSKHRAAHKAQITGASTGQQEGSRTTAEPLPAAAIDQPIPRENMQPFDWSNPYPTVRTPLFARNAVATSQPLAAQAGLRMLLNGGNAVDAAIAAAAALTVVEPVSCGLGSDAFAILWDGKQLHGLNASGSAPAAWTPDYFSKKYGSKRPERGWDTVTVPGATQLGCSGLNEKPAPRFCKLMPVPGTTT